MSHNRNEIMSNVWRDGLFKDKVLFCTGGAGTICSVQVRAFVLLGGNAYIIGRNVEKTERVAKEIQSIRPGARVIGQGSVDVRNMQSLQEAADRCAKELGGIDYAIAGAAGNFLAPISQLSSNAFRSVLEIDTLGSFHTAKAVLPYLIQSAKKYPNTGSHAPNGTGGRLIFISATFHYRGQALQSHVAAAKSAVDQISHSVSIEYGPLGITSNVITPGPIANTEGMERLAKLDAESAKASRKEVPIGRWGEVREIADATIYLFSEAGSFVNGNILVVDGGAWRTAGPGSAGFQYPDFILGGDEITGVKTGRKEKPAKL
jgi:peroxisomal 2,4-dienoyl-CoA reductase